MHAWVLYMILTNVLIKYNNSTNMNKHDFMHTN